MHISIKNLGIVQTAEIELNGLTILTGNNDTGKSFIGKIIFSVIKTLKNAPHFYSELRVIEIISCFNRILQAHRSIAPFDVERIKKFNSNYLKNSIYEALEHGRDEEIVLKMIDDFKTDVFNDIHSYLGENNNPSDGNVKTNIEKVDYNFNSIYQIFGEKVNKEDAYKAYFNEEIINYFFEGQLNSFNGEILEIKFIEGASVLLSIYVENNKVKYFEYNSDNPILQTDATIIDTPTVLILDNHYSPYRGNPQGRRPLPFHYIDLLEKIGEINGSPSTLNSNPEVFEEIKNIIHGAAGYNNESKILGFLRDGSDAQINTSNLATGIKSFSLLQLLLLSGSIKQDSILIVDEPEVHLHPKWEIEYAKIIVELSKAGIPIIISTHSPYFLQAAIKYVKENNTEKITKFYFGESLNEGKNLISKFKDVTNDLEPIFTALAKPMRDIYFN